MPFDISNLNPSARFYYPGTKKAEWIELRNISMSDIRQMRKKTVDKKIEYYRPDNSNERPFRYEIENIDEDELFSLMWDYQIVNWKIIDPNGKEIPCTIENKLLMIGKSNEFAEWVMKCLKQLSKDDAKSKKDSEKN